MAAGKPPLVGVGMGMDEYSWGLPIPNDGNQGFLTTPIIDSRIPLFFSNTGGNSGLVQIWKGLIASVHIWKAAFTNKFQKTFKNKSLDAAENDTCPGKIRT